MHPMLRIFHNKFLHVKCKICLVDKVRDTLLYNIRIVIRIFQPQISRKIRILQPGPDKHSSYLKKKFPIVLFIDFKFPLLKYLLDSSSCTDFKSSIVEVKQCVGYRSWYVHIKAKHSFPALSRMWLDTVFIADRGTKYCTLMDAMPVKASHLLQKSLSHTFCAFHTRFSFLEWFQWIGKIKKKNAAFFQRNLAKRSPEKKSLLTDDSLAVSTPLKSRFYFVLYFVLCLNYIRQ